MDFTPLYMSCIAGLSTGIGAATVFFQPQVDGKSNTRLVSHSQMCYSLALAGSVMITVSVVSIIPECLRDATIVVDDSDASYHMISLWSTLFLERLVSFAVGCTLYLLLSKLAFPEPEEVTKQMLDVVVVDDKEKEKDLESSTVSIMVPSSSHDSMEELLVDDRSAITTTKTTKQSATSTTKQRKINYRSRATSPGSPDRDGVRIMNRSVSSVSSEGEIILDSPLSSGKPVSFSEFFNEENKNDFFNFVTTYSSGADLKSNDARRAWRVAMLLFVSLAFHNFPEGLAVAASALESQKLGLTVTIGIMIHNIPEGIAIAIPCLAARPDKPSLAFWLATLSGLAEPLGALVALLLLGDISNGASSSSLFTIDNVLAFVAGIMIMVAVAELFPEALRHTEGRNTSLIAGTLSGVAIMLATELYLPS